MLTNAHRFFWLLRRFFEIAGTTQQLQIIEFDGALWMSTNWLDVINLKILNTG